MSRLSPATYPKFDGTQRCRHVDAELFFPVSTSELPVAVRQACAECAFRSACLSYAMANGLDGIWGGTTEHERRALRQQRGPVDELPRTAPSPHNVGLAPY